jgi:hypothetical protein
MMAVAAIVPHYLMGIAGMCFIIAAIDVNVLDGC